MKQDILPTTPLISLSGVNMIRDGRTILSDVNIVVNHNDFMAITGPNGGGKTTLLRILLQLIKPTSGTVTYYDAATGRSTDHLSIGYLPQKNMIDSKFPITVREVVGMGLPYRNTLSGVDVKEAEDEVIETVGLTSHASVGIGSLSGGQLQRALLGRAIISRPSLLVLDEPLSYVDRRFEQRIYDIVASLAPTTTIILVSHDMARIASMANRHIIVDRTVESCHSDHHFLHYDCCDSPD